jgi:general secretion pathway protein K
MPGRKRIDRRDGFVLVVVLWLLGSLAALVAVYSLYLTNTATAFTTHLEKAQAESLVAAGLELVAYQLTIGKSEDKKPGEETKTVQDTKPAEANKPAEDTKPAQDTKPAKGGFSFRAGKADVSVQFSPENARIDLNAAPKELLAGLFRSLGARREAEYLAERIIGWRTPRNAEAAAREDETTIYRSAGLPYGPREAPFAHVYELGLVAGMPAEIARRAAPLVTVHSGSSAFNAIEAPPELIAAIPGVTPEQLPLLLRARERDLKSFQSALASLDSGNRFVTTEPGKSTRVAVNVAFASGYRMRTEATIIVVDGDTEPYRVLSYRNDESSLSAQTRTR